MILIKIIRGFISAESLKNKVAASIVAISSIHLLGVFMDLKNIPDNKLLWYVVLHLTFVLSAFVMGYLEKISKRSKSKDKLSRVDEKSEL